MSSGNTNKKDNLTITQIAQECGVSVATVSRVLNGNLAVSPEKRKRIEQVIAKYHFTPNSLARGLVRKETRTLGVIIPDISNPYFSTMFLETERYALEAGYTLLLCNTLYGGSSHGIANTVKESRFFQMMLDRQVDGVLIFGGQVDMTTVDDEYRLALEELHQRLPVVVIGKAIPGINCTFLQSDTGMGVTMAVNYLYGLGHRRIAFVGGQSGVTITDIRLQAYKDALKALHMPVTEDLTALTNYYPKDGYDAITRLVGNHVDFTAAVTINDNVALGAQRALADYGLSVPNDVAVISCEQFPGAEYRVPRLTAVDMHHELLARTAITTLINIIRDIPAPVLTRIQPDLIIRESCGTALGIKLQNRTEESPHNA